MRSARVGVALAVALALQTTLVPLLPGILAVDLVLVVVVLVAMSGGPVPGLWTGTVGGLLQDALSGGVVGVGGLSKTLVGFMAGRLGVQFDVDSAWQRLLVLFFGSLVHTGCFVGVYSLLSEDAMLTTYGAALSQAAANAVVGVIATLVLATVPSGDERRRRRRRRLARRFGG